MLTWFGRVEKTHPSSNRAMATMNVLLICRCVRVGDAGAEVGITDTKNRVYTTKGRLKCGRREEI